jgi:hypothetical protein
MGMHMNWQFKDDPRWPFGRIKPIPPAKKLPRRTKYPADMPPAKF